MIVTVLGIGLIVLALRDIFDTLFRPYGRGVLSERAASLVWRVARAVASERHPAPMELAGPAGFLVVILVWVAMVTLGGALLIDQHLAEGYVFQSAAEEARYSGLVDAISISLVNLTSLGLGDAVPSGSAMRLLGPLQALIGLGLITVTVSWILSIYRIITLVTVLSRDIDETLGNVEFDRLGPDAQRQALSDLASRVTEVRSDMGHFPISYYFRAHDDQADLCTTLPDALASSGELIDRSPSAEVGFYARRLNRAIAELAEQVDQQHLGGAGGSTEEILERWRRDHRRDAAGASPG